LGRKGARTREVPSLDHAVLAAGEQHALRGIDGQLAALFVMRLGDELDLALHSHINHVDRARLVANEDRCIASE